MRVIKLNGKSIQVRPLTWEEVPEFSRRFADALDGMDNIRKAFFRFVTSKPDEKSLMGDVVAAFPALVTEALALGLRVDAEQVRKASPLEVMEAIEACIEVHRLKELLERGKKLRGLLTAPSQPASDEAGPKTLKRK